MLYFLPDHHQKNIKYYGIYSKGIKNKLKNIEKASWATAVKHCFACTRKGEKDPEIHQKAMICHRHIKLGIHHRGDFVHPGSDMPQMQSKHAAIPSIFLSFYQHIPSNMPFA